jgi:hypothetical protein
VGPQQGRKVFTLQTLPDESDSLSSSFVAETAGFSLHAGVATRANERAKLERLCRYVTRPLVSTKRLSLTRNGQVRYELKTGRRNTNDWKKLSYFFMLKLSNILLPGKLSGVRK